MEQWIEVRCSGNEVLTQLSDGVYAKRSGYPDMPSAPVSRHCRTGAMMNHPNP